MRSFDATRDRRAPRQYRGMTLQGEVIQGDFVSPTLIVAVKEDCLGCRSVMQSPEGAFGDVEILIVAARPSAEAFWRTCAHRVVVSESLLRELDVRWPPFFVLIDPANETVLCEGVVFAPEQVRDEIAPFVM